MRACRCPFTWAWLLLILAAMVGVSLPLDQWGGREITSAAAFFIIAGPGGMALAKAVSWAAVTFSDGLKDGLRQAVQERELSEAELE